MKTLATTLVLTGVSLAGCSSVGTGAPARTISIEQAICEQPRGGGVWVPSAGACIRGGGAM